MNIFEERMSVLLKGHSVSSLLKAYQELSQRYRQPMYKPGFRNLLEVKAYTAARMPATLAAVKQALSELPQDFSPQTILDLGAGTGAASLAALELFPASQELILIEQDKDALEVAQTFLATSSPVTNLVFQHKNLNDYDYQKTYDLVILSYVLNELPETDQPIILEKVLKTKSTFILIVMPGTPLCYNQLIKLRQFAIEGGYFIAAPCPHQARCPLSDTADDWCHFSVRLPRSKQHQQFKKASLNFEDEKYSYLLLSKEPIYPQHARVIKKPLHRSGHSTLDICDKDGHSKRLTISRKEREAYNLANKAEWGDILKR